MQHADPAAAPARSGSTIAPGSDRDMLELDDYELPEFLSVAARFGIQKYGYVITPNVDHLIRYHDDAAFRALYTDAAYVLLDSRFLSHLFRLIRGLRVRVCTGSDLTAQLFARVIAPPDRLVLIGGSAEQAQMLAAQHGLTQLSHYNPPMGFIRDPRAVEECLQFIEAHSPFRFCFLAVGAPQQEILAQMLKTRGIARGMALCIGASVNFMTGVERRAPRWMQRIGAEWVYRLMHDPGRLAKRYLVRGPRVFWLLPLIDIQLRARSIAPVLAVVTAGIETQDTIY
jgi:exopolysaccharide biosynthesis WecB/TagA/CpsF family protein